MRQVLQILEWASRDPGHSVPNCRLRTLLLLFVVLGSSLAVFGAWGIVVFALLLGLASCLHQGESFRSLTYLAVVMLGLTCLIALLWPAINTASDEMGRRVMCINNLKQIALALQAYHQANGCFPPAYITDKNGKPMHSWRVLILPYLEETPLYKAYDFTQPWNGPKNMKLLATRPLVYACACGPGALETGATQTSYVAVVGPNAAWAGGKPKELTDIGSNVSGTIMVVEVANSGIDWAEPRDLSLDAIGVSQDKSPALVPSNNHGQREGFFFTYDYGARFNVAMVDGSVHYLLTLGRSNEDLRKTLQIGGCGDDSRGGLFDVKRRVNWPNIAALAVWLLSVGTLLTRAVRSRKYVPGAK